MFSERSHKGTCGILNEEKADENDMAQSEFIMELENIGLSLYTGFNTDINSGKQIDISVFLIQADLTVNILSIYAF